MNEINLYGMIGEAIDASVIKRALAQIDQTQPLIVRIDSEGGAVFDGLSLYDAFAAYPGPKKAIIQPAAFSIASYIATAFDEVEIVSNGYVMIHNPLLASVSGNAKELSQNVELLTKLQASMVEAYSKKTGQPLEVVSAWMDEEKFFNAQEAVQYGFASRVIDTRASSTMLAPVAIATKLKMPPQVYASLSASDGLGGDKREPTKEKSMSTATPVAASLQEIRAALPKAKSDFVLTCLERQLPIAQVQALAMEELTKENEAMATQNTELMAKINAMEGELKAIKASMAPPAPNLNPELPIVIEAKTGVRPVAVSPGGAPSVSAQAQWDSAIREELTRCGGNKLKAIQAVVRSNPGLRERVVQEANA